MKAKRQEIGGNKILNFLILKSKKTKTHKKWMGMDKSKSQFLGQPP
jgi:hypothetical protein